MNPCGPSPAFVAASNDSLESRFSRIDMPGFGVGCLILDWSLERTSWKGLGMKRVIRVMVWDSSCVVAIAEVVSAVLIKDTEEDLIVARNLTRA